MTTFDNIDECGHEPKIAIRTYSVLDKKHHYAICEKCSRLKIFIKFAESNFIINEQNRKFLKLSKTYTIKKYKYSDEV